MVQTPDEWLADFEKKVADLQQKATEFKTDIEASGATAVSGDEAVTVTVAANGSLTDLRLTDAAMRKSAGELATEILAMTRQARQTAASRVAEAFVPLGGDRDVLQRIAESVSDDQAPAAPARKRSEVDDEDYDNAPVVLHDVNKW